MGSYLFTAFYLQNVSGTETTLTGVLGIRDFEKLLRIGVQVDILEEYVLKSIRRRVKEV